ncbi:MAG: 3-oxoacid CoA-transferase subunit A [Chloroflexi bacterium]|nr:3-oxoacid CoA-transferase subunit A [Chloroflexota bacterium]
MPLDKVVPDFRQAVADVFDGASIFVDGFGGPGGMAQFLLLTLWERGVKGLTLISNTAGIGMTAGFGVPGGRAYIDHSILIENGRVKKIIASFPVAGNPSRVTPFERAFRQGKIELEVVPQGTLAERIRAGGAGIGAFYTPTGAGTLVAQGKETRAINGREHVLEYALTADFAFVRAARADRAGNLVYKGSSRNFNAVMATAARVTIVEADEIVEVGGLDPECIITPCIYVDRVVPRPKDDTPVLAETYYARVGARAKP